MTGLDHAPCFSPVVGDFYSGMVMSVPLHGSQLLRQAGPEYIRKVLEERYAGEALIRVNAEAPADGFIYSNPMSGSNGMEIYVTGNSDRILLAASYDNLGKGASGAAVQNMNIVLGADETAGLI